MQNLDGKILVAGASGLVGVNTLARLRDLGADVRGTYYSSEPDPEFQALCDRYNFTEFDDCLAATRDCKAVLLCANSVLGSAAMKANPTGTLLPNLKITAGLLEACARNEVERVVLISSSTVFQEAYRSLREDELDLNTQPFSLYRGVGWFHRYAEQMAMHYHVLGAFQCGIIRPTALFGPYDHFAPERSQVLPANIRRSLERETPYVVWGDGYAVRDFHYVKDFVEDMLLVLERYCAGDPVNSASGTPITIREAVAAILKATGHDVQPQYDVTKNTAIRYRSVDTTKFDALFGPARRTPFAEAIQATVDWYRQSVARGA